MYLTIDLENVEPHDLDEADPTLLPVGLELKPERMRPSVWHYERGEENAFH